MGSESDSAGESVVQWREAIVHLWRILIYIGYDFPVAPKEFAIVFDAIPAGTLMLFWDVTKPIP